MKEKETIIKRLAEIRGLYDQEGADTEKLDQEVRSLKAELEAIEAREQLFAGIDFSGAQHTPDTRTEQRSFDPATVRDQPEYRTAFLRTLMRQDLSEVEQRAFTTALNSAGAVIPTVTLNMVAEVIEQHAPLLQEINLFRVPGYVTVPVEDVVAQAAAHEENALITPANDTLKPVTLHAYEIVKLLQISKSVAQMSVDAFERWLADNLGRAIAAKITGDIIAGTGTGEAKGLNTITWDATNSVTVALASALTAQNILDVIGLLPGGFDPNAKFIMAKKTLFTDFMPLKDAAKHDLVTREGNSYYVYGYPVQLDERVTFHEAYLGDFRAGYYANMPEDVTVTGDFDVKTNSFNFLGCAMFGGEPVLSQAFVKLIKASA